MLGSPFQRQCFTTFASTICIFSERPLHLVVFSTLIYKYGQQIKNSSFLIIYFETPEKTAPSPPKKMIETIFSVHPNAFFKSSGLFEKRFRAKSRAGKIAPYKRYTAMERSSSRHILCFAKFPLKIPHHPHNRRFSENTPAHSRLNTIFYA